MSQVKNNIVDQKSSEEKTEVTMIPIDEEYAKITTKFDSQIKEIVGLIFSEKEIESITKIRDEQKQ